MGLTCYYLFYRDFDHPQPQEQTIRESVGHFLAAIDIGPLG